MIRKLLLSSSFAFAMAFSHAQSDVVQDWIDAHDSGLVNFDFGEESEGSLYISTQYLYGSFARAIGNIYPMIEPLSKEWKVGLLATASAQDKSILQGERNELVEGLKEDGLEEFITMKNADMDFTMYAIEDGDHLNSFVFMMFNSDDQLRVIDFEGRVHLDELYKLISNPENLEGLMSLGDLEILEID